MKTGVVEFPDIRVFRIFIIARSIVSSTNIYLYIVFDTFLPHVPYVERKNWDKEEFKPRWKLYVVIRCFIRKIDIDVLVVSQPPGLMKHIGGINRSNAVDMPRGDTDY